MLLHSTIISSVVSAVTTLNLLFIYIDFNAKLGLDNVLHTYHSVENINGALLQKLAINFP